MRYLFLLFLLSALTSGCTNPAGLNMAQYRDVGATPSDFVYCHGYGCSQKIRLGLHDSEWNEVKKIFKNSKNAKDERQKIAKAIARMEKITGQLADTSDDLPKAPIIKKSHQELDCIDETVNTTKYLTFFEQAGLLKFHKVGKPAFKGFFINGIYPHNTATVIEKETGKIFVIDSYIFANGEKPVIRSHEDWMKTGTFESAEF